MVCVSLLLVYIAASATVDGFTSTYSSYYFFTNHRGRSKSFFVHRGRRLFGSRNQSLNNNYKLSRKQQEDLWQSNALYFEEGGTKFITSNTWPRSSWGRKLRKRAARPYLQGVEIRRLPASHPLEGQLGLFAAKRFEQFDIVGEYCGEVFDETRGGGEYATYLEHRDERYALGVNARREGNECRFINHYERIADRPNVVMKIAYVEELPRVMIVCTKAIDIGEEFLLRYSDDYVEEYIATPSASDIIEPNTT